MSDIPFSVSMITAYVVFFLFILLFLLSLMTLLIVSIYYDIPSVFKYFIREGRIYHKSNVIDFLLYKFLRRRSS